MEFRVLGPLEMWAGERRRPLGYARERRLLAILLMSPGKPVATEALIQRVWDGDPPDRARDRLYPHITRLRGRLADLDDVRLESRSGGYVLDVDRSRIDYHLFRDLRSQARSMAETGDREYALRLFRDATALWRGEPLDGVDGTWAEQRRQSIRDELLAATRERLELELELENRPDLTTDLNDLLAQFPHDEKLAELLMLALHRTGRSAEALRAYDRFRRLLDESIGTMPGQELRELHRRILNDDPALMAPPRPPERRSPPSDLPPDTHTFTGRDAEFGELMRLAAERSDTVTVVAISGMPGVGKTALAVRLARRLAPEHPDGQIFLHLRAHDPGQEPMEPTAALDRLLRSLRVPQHLIPNDLDGRSALWRTETSRRRLLLVLDDALDTDQVRPLLPGAPGCLVVVTGRRRLVGLDAVRPLTLHPLPPEDSALLLARVAGPRVTPGAPGVGTVTRLCGHLPLALQMVGLRLRHRESWTAVDLAESLGEGRRLERLRAENREVAAAFRLSVEGLDAAARQAFLLLGLYPGAEVTADALAVMLGGERSGAEACLELLHDHSLIIEPSPGRYRFHDLLREYARDLAVREPSLDRDGALDRLIDHCLATADRADRILFPRSSRPPVEVRSPGLDGFSLDSEDEARSWFEAELENLIGVARFAADEGRPRRAGLLARALERFLEDTGRWSDAVRLHTIAVEAWRRVGDRRSLARALLDLGHVRWRTGRYEDALAAATEALRASRAIGDDALAAESLDLHGRIHYTRSEFDVAVGYYEQALALRREAGDRTGEAHLLSHLGIVLYHLGRYPEAMERMNLSLTLTEEAGDVRGRQMALNNAAEIERRLGLYDVALRHYEQVVEIGELSRQHEAIWCNNIATIYSKTRRPAEAITQYRRAIAIYTEIGDRRGETDSLNGIGDCYAQMGRDGEALIHHQKALQLAREISEKYEQSWALRAIGEVHHRAGRHGQAQSLFDEALVIARSIGDTFQEARVLESMGEAIARLHGPAEAETTLRQALELYESLGVPEAEALRQRLADPPDAAGS
ncbi:tetratricopeptide repeat protein [Actinomadura sp. SCN-SB]|uniref:AfsR/SARP family transcriptional regulator n=1 Tax=Actinomadura sp. SCN-SB TaxID=3373092 RepID=UPI0037539263